MGGAIVSGSEGTDATQLEYTVNTTDIETAATDLGAYQVTTFTGSKHITVKLPQITAWFAFGAGFAASKKLQKLTQDAGCRVEYIQVGKPSDKSKWNKGFKVTIEATTW